MGEGEAPRNEVHISGIGRDLSGVVVAGNGNSVYQQIFVGRQGSTVADTDAPPAPVPRTSPVGRPLPRGDTALGRQDELSALEEGLAATGRVQVHGGHGAGKSTLLRQLVMRRAAAGGAVVFLSAAGVNPEDLLQELFQACYAAPGYLPDPDTLARLMSSIEALVVVDDFTGTSGELAALVKAVPGCDLAVASPERTLFGGGRALELGGLEPEPALELLARELGRPLEPAEEETALELWRATGGNPAALVQVAATGTLSPDADGTALAGALALGLEAPARDALSLLCAMGGLPVPADLVTALAAVRTTAAKRGSAEPALGGLGVAPQIGADVREGLERLGHARLVEEGPAGYETTGDLADAVAAEAGLAVDPAIYAPAYTAWLNEAGVAETARTAPLAVRILEAAVETGEYAAARDLARAVAPALALGLRWAAWGRVLGLGFRAARALGSAEDRAYFEGEERVRLKALGKGVAAGVALGGAFALGTQMVAGSGGGGAGWLSGLLGKPTVITVTAGIVVGGGIAAMGVAAARDQPSVQARPSVPVVFEPPKPSGSSPSPSSSPGPERPPSTPPTSQTQRPPTEDRPDRPDRPDEKETDQTEDPGSACAPHSGNYYNRDTFAVYVKPAGDGYEGQREITLTWPPDYGDDCFRAGDASRLHLTNPSNDNEQYYRMLPDSSCDGQLVGGQSCRLTIVATPPEDLGYYLVELRIPVKDADWGYSWDVALAPDPDAGDPSPTETTTSPEEAGP